MEVKGAIPAKATLLITVFNSTFFFLGGGGFAFL